MSQMTAPKISVLGDGISSFEGYVPRQASFYSPSYVSYSGFDTPDGMWWMQLTKMLGGEFLANSAYAGSHVSYAGHYSACLPRRIRSLATEEASPDIILAYSGIAHNRDRTFMLLGDTRHDGNAVYPGRIHIKQFRIIRFCNSSEHLLRRFRAGKLVDHIRIL